MRRSRSNQGSGGARRRDRRGATNQDEEGAAEAAPEPIKFLGTWEDGIPRVAPSTRCAITGRKINGPALISGGNGSVVYGFNVSYVGIDKVLQAFVTKQEEERRAREQALLETTMQQQQARGGGGGGGGSTGTSTSSTAQQSPLPPAPPQPAVTYDSSRAGRIALRMLAGDILNRDHAPRIGKCYHCVLSGVHARPTRLDDMRQIAIEARAQLMAEFRKRDGIARSLRLKVKCGEEMHLVSGEYLNCYDADGEVKLAEYYGEVKGGKPHGRGYKVWLSGAEYRGEWKDGLEHTTSVGVNSTFHFTDGSVYTGSYSRGKRHGRGVKVWPDGKRYEGDFALGLEHGTGKITFQDLSVFEGRFRFGLRDGMGVLTRADGTKQKGHFKDKREHGQGAVDDTGMGSLTTLSLQEFPVGDLLTMCTTRLAECVSASPNLYSARTLQRAIPAARKPIVARAFVEASKDLSPGFKTHVPELAWQDREDVVVNGIKLNTSDISMLIYFLETNTTLRRLQLQSSGLDASSLSAFTKLFVTSPTLCELDLCWNKLGKQGAQAITTCLRAAGQASALTSLRLMGCELKAGGAEFIAMMLRKNHTLTRVDLAFNDIGSLGAACVADAVAENDTLEELDLRSNKMGPSGAEALSAALLRNCGKLKTVKVADNGMGPTAAAYLAGCMRGRADHGLVNFSAREIVGPNCIPREMPLTRRSSGNTGEGARANNNNKEGGDAARTAGGSEGRGQAQVKQVEVVPPKIPGVRLISDAV